jgi:hypothetical protein
LSIVSIMADEANVSVEDVLLYRSIQVRFKKIGGTKHHVIMMNFQKVWDFSAYKDAATMQGNNPIVTSVSSVVKRLYDLMHASYEDRVKVDMRRESMPSFVLSVSQFTVYVEQLLLLLILILVLVNHVFEMSKRKEDTQELFTFCEKLFHTVHAQGSYWKLLEYMLRVHY